MKAHLLAREEDFDLAADLPAGHADVIKDLELDTVLDAMAQGDSFLRQVAKHVLLSSLIAPDAIRYRQRVLADCLAHPDLVRHMYDIAVEALQDKRRLWGYSSRNPSSVLSGAVGHVELLVGRLRELREIADEHATTFASEALTGLMRSLQADLDDAYLRTLRNHLRQLRFRDGEVMTAELSHDISGINYVLRAEGARRTWKERVGLEPRSVYSFTLPPRDEAGGEILQDMINRGLNRVANALAQSADHITSYFNMLRIELGFYVGCLNLADQLASKGQPVSFPEPLPLAPPRLTATELCDMSLALRIDRVVGNDLAADGKRLVIVTGANSGGKSTFLRSVGAAQLMMQCGLFVAADLYRASICTAIFTHFIREEDAEMVRGRLDEELARMSEVADQVRRHCLVLFNESFAATNEREGSEIGRQIVRAMIEAGIRVFFVTHQYDLADGFHRQDLSWAHFIRAERNADGTRDFRLIAAPPLPTSFGEDLYERIGRW